MTAWHDPIQKEKYTPLVVYLSLLLLFQRKFLGRKMPSLNNKPSTPAAPNDMTTADSYERIADFLNKNPTVQQFEVEDDNHGMGMISTLEGQRQAINMRLDQSTIRNYMVNNGFTFTTDSICLRK
jgi:hypothetical protein